jgi:hypothetical protein
MDLLKLESTFWETEFPILSQTNNFDKLAILKIRDILTKNGKYNYCEIGSYLGGSLTPFIRDINCEYILSVDDRNKIQSDERSIDYHYRHISHQTMLDELSKYNLDLSKLETFDGSINQLSNDNKFDLIFIDAEHTDYACFRDFVYSQKYIKQNSVIMFHDSNLIYKSLKIIQELLVCNGVRHKFIKVKNSSVSFIFFGDYLDFYKKFDVEETDKFYNESEIEVIQHIIDNRVDSNFKIKDKICVII